MSTELGALLGRAAEELSTDGPLDDLRAAGLRRVVRRRRVQRHTVESVAGVAAAGVIGTAAWFGSNHVGPPPPADPSPSISASPTPLVTAPPVPGMPAAFVAPAGILGQTGPGWSMYVNRPTYRGPGEDAGARHADDQAVYLVDPHGQSYLMATIPVDPQVNVLHWDAGSSRARVEILDSAPSHIGWLDVQTGEMTRDEPDVPTVERAYLTTLPDGTELWSNLADNLRTSVFAVPPGQPTRLVGSLAANQSGVLLDPAARWIVSSAYGMDGVDLLAVADGAVRHVPFGRGDGEDCTPVGWIDHAGLMISCVSDEPGILAMRDAAPALYRVDAEGGPTTLLTRLAVGDPFPVHQQKGAYVTDGTIAFAGTILAADAPQLGPFVCETGIYAWDGDGFAPVYESDRDTDFFPIVHDGVLYVRSISKNPGGGTNCLGSNAGPASVTAVDLTTGTQSVLTPAPEPATGVEFWWGGFDALRGWALAASGS